MKHCECSNTDKYVFRLAPLQRAKPARSWLQQSCNDPPFFYCSVWISSSSLELSFHTKSSGRFHSILFSKPIAVALLAKQSSHNTALLISPLQHLNLEKKPKTNQPHNLYLFSHLFLCYIPLYQRQAAFSHPGCTLNCFSRRCSAILVGHQVPADFLFQDLCGYQRCFIYQSCHILGSRLLFVQTVHFSGRSKTQSDAILPSPLQIFKGYLYLRLLLWNSLIIACNSKGKKQTESN